MDGVVYWEALTRDREERADRRCYEGSTSVDLYPEDLVVQSHDKSRCCVLGEIR